MGRVVEDNDLYVKTSEGVFSDVKDMEGSRVSGETLKRGAKCLRKHSDDFSLRWVSGGLRHL